MVSSRRNCDIKEQETGVELAPKLPQIVSINNYARGGQRQGQLYSTALNQPRRTTFALRFGRGSISMGRRYQLTNSSHPARGESFVSLLCSTLAIPHHCFFSLPNSRRTNRGSRHRFSKLKDARPTVSASPPLSLSLSAPEFRHSDILRHNVENRRTQGSFSFSFLTPNESRRLSPCRERVVYPPLVAVCRGFGASRVRHCFFFFSLRVLPPR